VALDADHHFRVGVQDLRLLLQDRRAIGTDLVGIEVEIDRVADRPELLAERAAGHRTVIRAVQTGGRVGAVSL